MSKSVLGAPTLVCLLVAAMAAGCGTSRESAFEKDATASASVSGDASEMHQKAEAHWRERTSREHLDKAIALWEELVQTRAAGSEEDEQHKQRARIYERLARAYFLLGDAHIRPQHNADADARRRAMIEAYDKGITAAEEAIALRDPAFAKKMAQGERWAEEVYNADPAAIEALYWYSTNLGRWALLEGLATIMARKADLEATMDFICQTDETFFYGACHRYFAVYWTRLPIGADAERSRKHFEKTIEIGPKFLANKVLMAQELAPLEGDRKMFDRLIDEVLATPAEVEPAIAPENHFAKQKARRLQERADELF